MIAATVPDGFGPSDLATRWVFDPLVVLALVAAAWVYVGGLRRVRAAGRPFPRRWVTAWFAGLGTVALALVSPIDAYADALLWVHMVQHLLLTLVAPPLLALGAPVTLALRAASPRMRRRSLLPILRSRPVAILANPVVGWVLFVGAPFAIHFSPLFDLALRDGTVHAFEHGLWLGTALVYWWPIVGRDPMPHRMSYPARMLSMLLTMPATSFAALAIYGASTSLYPAYSALPEPWGSLALGSQRVAAVIMWLVGNLAMVVAMLVCAAAWRRDEERRATGEVLAASAPTPG